MAKQTVTVSDLTGRVVENPVRVSITTSTKAFALDADQADDLIVELVSHAREQAKRGRKRKVAAVA